MAADTADFGVADAGTGRVLGSVAVALGLVVVALAAVGPRPMIAGPIAVAVVTADLVRVDIARRRLPNALVLPCYPAAIAGIALDGILIGSSPVIALAAGCSWFVFLLLLHLGGGMGMGDVKLAGVLGLALGAVGVLPAIAGLVLAFLTGGIAGAIVLARRVGGVDTRIPFGPFLLAGFWLALALSPGLTPFST